ncbi:hypothetical protein TNCV_4752071 [Trichonephila clavipes]|nr:hypothetical protein TNCV_4752071 [Trichonephila clavipes]
MKSVETNLAFILFRQDVGGDTHSQPCSRGKNGIDGLVENRTQALNGNPTMTLRLVAKWTFSQISLIQEHDRGPFEKILEAPTRLNFFKFVLGTLIGHTNCDKSIRNFITNLLSRLF